MRKKGFSLLLKKSVFVLGLCISCFSAAKSQEIQTEAISSAGKTEQLPKMDLLLSWTIGESIIETYSNNSILLVQGFHQPKVRITVLTEPGPLKNTVTVFPNPAVDYVHIQLGEDASSILTTTIPQKTKAVLRTLTGQLVFEAEFESREHLIDVSQIANGMYILQLFNMEHNALIGSYTVEKLK